MIEELTRDVMPAESPDPAEIDPYYVLVGQAFMHLRGERTHDHLEATGGLSARTITKIEEGRIDVALRSHHTLARLLNTTLDAVHRQARALDPRTEPRPDVEARKMVELAQRYMDKAATLLRLYLG